MWRTSRRRLCHHGIDRLVQFTLRAGIHRADIDQVILPRLQTFNK